MKLHSLKRIIAAPIFKPTRCASSFSFPRSPLVISKSQSHSTPSLITPWQYTTQRRHVSLPTTTGVAAHAYVPPAQDLDKNITEEERRDYDAKIAQDKDRAVRTPWMREGAEQPPVDQKRSAGAMTKGKLLTTPTRLFKLVLPLTTLDVNTNHKDLQPLALLVHPQQPLSYLERLIQAELPLLEINGKEKIPSINFRALDSTNDDDIPLGEKGSTSEVKDADEEEAREERRERREQKFEQLKQTKDDKTLTHDKQESKEPPAQPQTQPLQSASDMISPSVASTLRGGPGEGGVESYSGLGREAPSDSSSDPSEAFVTWSKSTEIGDFVRDAARGREFAVVIEGAPREIRVGVPSFGDRTYYLRMRLRKRAREIANMADIKKECDLAAERGAQRIAYAAFGGMVGWLGVVYYLTFRTDLGWDFMEPVTYLVGLSGILTGYGWFLLNKREASYRSAMNLTISRRQQTLYETRGFDLRKWEYIMEESNALRREILAVAQEYDVEWDEKVDAKDEKVMKALREHRHKTKGKDGDKKGDDDD